MSQRGINMASRLNRGSNESRLWTHAYDHFGTLFEHLFKGDAELIPHWLTVRDSFEHLFKRATKITSKVIAERHPFEHLFKQAHIGDQR